MFFSHFARQTYEGRKLHITASQITTYKAPQPQLHLDVKVLRLIPRQFQMQLIQIAEEYTDLIKCLTFRLK